MSEFINETSMSTEESLQSFRDGIKEVAIRLGGKDKEEIIGIGEMIVHSYSIQQGDERRKKEKEIGERCQKLVTTNPQAERAIEIISKLEIYHF